MKKLNSKRNTIQRTEKMIEREKEISIKAFEELENRVMFALETYSNVHRGSGHFSLITTELYEEARNVILDCLGLNKDENTAIFCTPQQSEIFQKQLKSEDYQVISSKEIGLPLGLRVLAVKKNGLPKGIPFQTGGSVVKIVSSNYVVWADAPQKFEAGTPSIINAIAFAIALRIRKELGVNCFKQTNETILSISDIFYEDELSEYSGAELLEVLRKKLIGYKVQVPAAEGEKPFINLDNAASTPTFSPIWDMVCKVWRYSQKNYSQIINEVKKILSVFLNASLENYDIIFTGNTTEAINITARFLQNEYKNNSDFVILNTELEHNSNELPWRYIPGASLLRLPVDKEGFVNLNELEDILIKYNRDNIFGNKRIRIIAISGASNVLGTFNDIQSISKIAHKYGARILVDGAQIVAHRSVNIEELDIDYFVFSGHKVYAPFGTGVLLIKKTYIPDNNSELENIKTSGEENITGIAALGKSIILLQRIGLNVIEEKEKVLLRRLLKTFSEIQGLEIFGIKNLDANKSNQKGGVVSFSLRNIPYNLAAKELAEQGGIGIRTGCFCTHILLRKLLNINGVMTFGSKIGFTLFPGITRAFLPGLIRVSFGLQNDENDVDNLIKVLKRIMNLKTSPVNKLLALNRNGTPFLPHTQTQKQMTEFLDARVKKVYSINLNKVKTITKSKNKIKHKINFNNKKETIK